jgi:plastocyanin
MTQAGRLRRVLAAAAIVVSGCSRPEPAKPAAPQPQSPPPDSSTGIVKGKVPLPTPGATIIVVLEPKDERSFPPQTEKPVMDQVGLTFGPPLLFVRTGQPVEFRNGDDTLHNVHVSNEDTREGAFNVAIPTGGTYTYTFARDGFYHVGCDIHPAMSAEIVSATSPYATVADSEGTFELPDVEPGAYTLTIYASGTKTRREVEVKRGAMTIATSP